MKNFKKDGIIIPYINLNGNSRRQIRYSHIQEEPAEPEVENSTLGDVFGDLLNQIK